ncbi:MAG: transposase [Balneolales bacterium]
MPQSLCRIHLHLVFSTRNRIPYLKNKTVRIQLHSYLAGINKNLGSTTMLINGVEDHVHILCLQPKMVCIADHIRTLKTNSSTWAKRQGADYSKFAWQAGYGAFSVSESNVQKARQYIADQEKHHNKKSFKQEYRELLKKHNIDYDERYVWD